MFSDRKNTVQAKQWLDKCYLDPTLLETIVNKLYANFKCGCIDTNNAECSGCLNSVVVPENTKKLQKLVLADRKLKLHVISKELKISESTILHLSMRKLCSKWVLHLLTVDQKQQHVNDLEHCLQLFQCNKKEFLHKYMTMDEIWIHSFIPKSNQQSAAYTAAGESRPKQPKI